MEQNLKKLFKTGLGKAASITGLYKASYASRMLIVAFHRVNDKLPPDGLTCSSATFEKFCRYFGTHFRVVPLAEQIQACRSGRSMGGTLSITFDDGYLDNYEVAAPILKRLNLPATFFISSGFVGSSQIPFWDRDLPFQPGWMSWDQVRDLAAQGFDIGGHTINHIDLGTEDATRIRSELAESKQKIEQEIGRAISLFAYPFGGVKNITESSRELVKEAGFHCCVSCWGGGNKPIADPFHLKRIPISTWFASPHQLGAELLLNKIAN